MWLSFWFCLCKYKVSRGSLVLFNQRPRWYVCTLFTGTTQAYHIGLMYACVCGTTQAYHIGLMYVCVCVCTFSLTTVKCAHCVSLSLLYIPALIVCIQKDNVY